MKRSTMNTLAVAVLSLCVHSASASIFGISGGHSFERRQSPGGDAVCEQFSTATIANIAIFPEFVSNASAFCQTLSGGELPSAILPASAVPLPLPGTNGDTTSQFTSLCSIATVRADEAEGIVPANTAEPTSALAVIEFTVSVSCIAID
ncbi:hypothetical protein SARC_03679 [Sphaeroforma arctica JP610]|uniref:Uncharacterized protein n=1 Tax=Sphaeroforma arctica JP610 TaxID=667725 RepID=A0A0L0G5K8_9EUKA|nr:hypothetical protein SARC_03679 [Sphaeroforma arctica JP610]KNC84086.1 hypothetical protein SARC_03679 [Sphaeroforma arctica JP610]|eukprot:XP_014157988.1 hypothetical protein SARC_03679 [Sphaeroforma arctica JP610]